jgi:hypothetical protein
MRKGRKNEKNVACFTSVEKKEEKLNLDKENLDKAENNYENYLY